MALILYAATALALLAAVHRWLTPLSRTAAAVLFLLPFLFTGQALLTGRIYAPVDHPWETVPLNRMKEQVGLVAAHNIYTTDISAQVIPWRAATRAAYLRGEWPLWNPAILSGDILAQSGTPAVYSPLTLLALILPPAGSMTFTATVTHLLAALGAFLLARALGCREWAAFLAAAGFSFSTAIVFYVHWPQGLGWTLAPWVILGVQRRSFALLTAAFVCLLFAGHPETAAHVVLLAGLWALAMVPFRELPRLALAGVTALGLSAIFVLPLTDAALQTMEYATRKGHAGLLPGNNGIEALARLARDFFPWLHLRMWTLDGVGPHFSPDTAAVGSVILGLAILGVLRRTRATWMLTGLTVFCLAAGSDWSPVARLLGSIPLFELSLNVRLAFGGALFLALLAAMGAEDLYERVKTGRPMLVLTLTLVAIALGNLWLLRSDVVSHQPPAWGQHRVAAEIIGLAAAAAVVLLRKPQLLLAVVLVQRFVSDFGVYRSFEPRVAYPPIPILRPLENAQKPFRIVGHGNAFIPHMSTLYGLQDVRGYQALTFLRYRDTFPMWCVHQPVWFNRVDDLTRPFLSFLNVRYAITWDRDPPPEGWREVARQPGALLLENLHALDRAIVPTLVRVGYHGSELLAQMAEEKNFAERAWIEAGLPPGELPNGPGTVTIRETGPGYYLDATMANDGWVVVSLPAWRGWRASIDGRPVKTQFANYAFLGIRVPRGRHSIRLVYLPQSFVVGRAISFGTLFLLTGVALWRLRRTSRTA